MLKDSISNDDLLFDSEVKPSLGVTFKKIWIEASVVFLMFLVTAMLYPSIVLEKRDAIFPERADWSIFVVNFSQSLGDIIGRTL